MQMQPITSPLFEKLQRELGNDAQEGYEILVSIADCDGAVVITKNDYGNGHSMIWVYKMIDEPDGVLVVWEESFATVQEAVFAAAAGLVSEYTGAEDRETTRANFERHLDFNKVY